MKNDYYFNMSFEKAFDYADDIVDPRVQVELERLNSATDEINRLEVDLDEARNQFRHLLAESTIRINNCSKKLGSCIEKARPYYDARIKAKQALLETQKAAVNFERANSAHAAAKEMVYLAEEGLKTEGRTFDHAWQEMLNHATMRVNESESERTRSEAEHKRTSQNYQRAEVRVQKLQKELKKAISKSSLAIHQQHLLMNSIDKKSLAFLLEQEKSRVKALEKQVSNVKLVYAETLKNLEHISDEIHKTRQKNLKPDIRNEHDPCETNHSEARKELIQKSNSSNLTKSFGCAKELNSFQSDVKNVFSETGKDPEVYDTPNLLTPLSETSTTKYTSLTSNSSQPDTDLWSENSDLGNVKANAENGTDSSIPSPNSENDSSITEPPDAESEDELYKFPELFNSVNNRPVPDFKNIENVIKSENLDKSESKNSNFFEGIGICSFPAETELNINFSGEKTHNNDEQSNNWTEIKLHSPEDEQPFPTIKKGKVIKVKNELEEDYDIPYTPLSESEFNYSSNQENPSGTDKISDITVDEITEKVKVNSALNYLIHKNARKNNLDGGSDELENIKSLKGTPRKTNIRRQSLDMLWNNATGEKVKEIFSQSILKLSIGSLSERRSSESKLDEDSETFQGEGASEVKDDGNSYESNLTSQFGLQFFSKKSTKSEDGVQFSSDEKKLQNPQDSLSNQIGSFIARKEKFFPKKVPSPLEKTLGYLNADEDSSSDSESLASNDMLTDEQLASLVLDRDLMEIYQDFVS